MCWLPGLEKGSLRTHGKQYNLFCYYKKISNIMKGRENSKTKLHELQCVFASDLQGSPVSSPVASVFVFFWQNGLLGRGWSLRLTLSGRWSPPVHLCHKGGLCMNYSSAPVFHKHLWNMPLSANSFCLGSLRITHWLNSLYLFSNNMLRF